MYNQIEELEKKLKQGRSPASAVQPDDINVDGYVPETQNFTNSQTKQLFDLPDATRYTDPSVKRNLPGQTSSEVGGVAPDYSGYDDLLKRVEGLRPRDTSTADLINMGISTGLGALFGQTAVGAKAAGAYGMDRFNKAEKRSDSIEDMIMKIQMDKAGKMAAGRKGTAAKSGIDPNNLHKFRYRDAQGMLRTPQFVGDDGLIIKDPSDPVFSTPSVGFVNQQLPDGTTVQHAQMGTLTKEVGGQLPTLKTEKNAKGELVGLNDRTMQTRQMDSDFNKTSTELSPYASAAYKSASEKFMADQDLRATKDAYTDMEQGMAGLQKGDVAGAKIAVKMFSSALEKGRRTTDFDVQYAEQLDRGIVSKLNKWIEGKKEGAKLPDDIREELESGFAVIEASLAKGYDERSQLATDRVKSMIRSEYRDDLAFPKIKRFGRKEQDKLIDRSFENQKQWMSTGEWEQPVIIDGQPQMGTDGKPLRGRYIMKNGRPYLHKVIR